MTSTPWSWSRRIFSRYSWTRFWRLFEPSRLSWARLSRPTKTNRQPDRPMRRALSGVMVSIDVCVPQMRLTGTRASQRSRK